MKIAVIKTGGKQYVVTAGSKITVEKLTGKAGADTSVETLLVADGQGTDLEIGAPVLKTKIPVKVIEHTKGDKVHIVKFKNKVRYRRNVGHRQPHTQVEVGNF